MREMRSVVFGVVAPLNLTVSRVQPTRARRTSSALQWLRLIVPGVMLFSTLTRRTRLGAPVAAALAAGSFAAAVTAMVNRRRREAREAALDERLEQSFPASDPSQI